MPKSKLTSLSKSYSPVNVYIDIVFQIVPETPCVGSCHSQKFPAHVVIFHLREQLLFSPI